MDKNLKRLKKEYHDIPIPEELDFVVDQALNQSKKRKKIFKPLVGVAVAATIFIGSVNASPALARTLADVPVLGSIVNVLTFKEYKMDEETYNADIEVPAIENLENESLQAALNQRYLEESKTLYEQFQAEVGSMKEAGTGGHLGVTSGYEIKTDTDQILSIGRYVVNTAASSSTTYQFDTIDKKNEWLITLPSLFKDESYVEIISEEIKKQMLSQMEQDSYLIYWVENPNREDEGLIEPFEEINPNQNFYINEDHKLVIVFNEYEVAPGYMGVLEFVIPTKVMDEVLVSNEYIK